MKVKRKNQNTAHPFLTEIAAPKERLNDINLRGILFNIVNYMAVFYSSQDKRAVFYSLNLALNRRFTHSVMLIKVKNKGILFIFHYFSLQIE